MKKEKVKRLYVEDDVMTQKKTDLEKINDIKNLLKGKSNVIFKRDIEKILNT